MFSKKFVDLKDWNNNQHEFLSHNYAINETHFLDSAPSKTISISAFCPNPRKF